MAKQASRRCHRTVWFNAWKYNQEDALWRALLLVLLDDLEQLAAEATRRRSRARASRAAGSELLDLLREALYHETAWSEQGERSVNWTQALTAGAGLGLQPGALLSGTGPGSGRHGHRRR